MERKPSLEKEKKNISNFLPKALIEEINNIADMNIMNNNDNNFDEEDEESQDNGQLIIYIWKIYIGYVFNNTWLYMKKKYSLLIKWYLYLCNECIMFAINAINFS